MDNKDLNLFAARSGQTTPPGITTINFGGGNFRSIGGAFDFFIFEAAGGGNPDDVAIVPIFSDNSVGTAVNLPTTVAFGFGWGSTGLSIAGGDNGAQPIVGVGWNVTDMKDAGGSFLAANTVIKGISIVQDSGLSAGYQGLDVASFVAVVPEPSSSALILLGLGGLAFARRRN